MEFTATVQDFVRLIGEVLGVDPEDSEGAYVFDLASSGLDEPLELPYSYVEDVIQRLAQKTEVEETALYDGHCYEVLVREESPLRQTMSRRASEEGFTYHDHDNKVSYSLSWPSDEYLLFLLLKLSEIAPLRFAFRRVGPSYRMRRMLEQGRLIEPNVFEVLKIAHPYLLTLRVEAERRRSEAEFVRYANAFFFQISYNLDSALVPQRYFDDLVRTSRITGHRRSRMEELEPPRRFYIADLIYHYQLAVASDSPPLEYLSYYHVAEHFFEAVFHDDLIDRVRGRITQPDFSYRRKRDIKGLIDEISRSLKFRGERVTFSEQEALRLTLERYVDLVVLRKKLEQYDESLIEHYRGNAVAFCGGDCVDLEDDSDPSQTFRALAKRIYKTRNAIVHSKESERESYIPFEHDKILVKEVPLIRFIAEQIIIESSSLAS